MVYLAWDPWRELKALREEMEGRFGHFGRSLGLQGAFPPINVFQSDEGLTITAEVPGLKGEDLSVEAEGDMLKISGKRSAPDGVKANDFHRRERRTGDFTRQVRLPGGLDTDKVEAKLSDGVLTVRLPRAETAKPRRIEVRSAE